MRIKVNAFFIAALLFSFVFSAPARGDEFHYKNILIGERPAGMAGAYAAVSDDPSGLFYNPAGIVYAVGKKISASANAFYTTQTKYKNALGSSDWDRTSASLLPNFFGIIQPLGKGVLGISYAVPDSIIEDQDQTFDGITTNIKKYTINFNKTDNTYLFGPSYALEIKPGLSVGATVYFHYRRKKFILNQHTIFTDDERSVSNTTLELEESGLKPMVGVMWSPPELKYSFALTLSRTFVLNEDIFRQDVIQPKGDANTTISQLNFSSKWEYPWTVTLGAAYFPTNSLLFSGDVSYNTAVSDDFSDRRAVVNVALGTEYYLRDTVALRGGFYTNFANTEPINSGDSLKDDNIDLYGLSGSVSFFTRSTSLTFGMVYSFGSGNAQVNSLDPTAIQDLTASSLLIFIGTSYAF